MEAKTLNTFLILRMAISKNNCVAFLSVLFILLFPNSGFSQSYLLSSLPVEKELSSRQITCFFQDSKGFMWIGTEDGLNFYNANSIKSFKHDVKNKKSIMDVIQMKGLRRKGRCHCVPDAGIIITKIYSQMTSQ